MRLVPPPQEGTRELTLPPEGGVPPQAGRGELFLPPEGGPPQAGRWELVPRTTEVSE